MTVSGNALRLLHQSFGDLELRRDKLIVPPTEHILRCFVFERTPYKGLFYFWRVVMPLWVPLPTLMLDYGKRLLNGAYVNLQPTDFHAAVRELKLAISQGELTYLQSISGPAEFLSEASKLPRYSEMGPFFCRFQLALNLYLVGQLQPALVILDELASGDLQVGMASYSFLARELARDLRTRPASGLDRIKSWETDNIVRFGL
jgi:hypothetical protein